MKKLVAVMLCVIYLASLCGCGFLFVDKEQEFCNKTVNQLLSALDDKDADAIYNLFSISVQNESDALEGKIEELISLYNGSTDKIGDFSPYWGEGSQENGDVWNNVHIQFPVFSVGEYFWFHIEMMWENTSDEKQIGITQIDFYTADAYYDEFFSDEDWQKNKGLNIFNRSVDEYNIISINNTPYDCHFSEAIDLEEVKVFFKESTSLNEFVKKFGGAAASNELGTVYILPEQEGENRYLYLCCYGDEIVYSDIVSNFDCIENVLKLK